MGWFMKRRVNTPSKYVCLLALLSDKKSIDGDSRKQMSEKPFHQTKPAFLASRHTEWMTPNIFDKRSPKKQSKRETI
jgi:hypothetical protein